MNFKDHYLKEAGEKNDILYHTTLAATVPKILEDGIIYPTPETFKALAQRH